MYEQVLLFYISIVQKLLLEGRPYMSDYNLYNLQGGPQFSAFQL